MQPMSRADSTTTDAKVAWQLCIELTTRITTQPLPLLHGDEATALDSVANFFKDARKTIASHPGCHESARITLNVLNHQVRPFTAKWHRRKEIGRLRSTDECLKFRAELQSIQQVLRELAQELAAIAGMQCPQIADGLQPPLPSTEPLRYGIPSQDQINETERDAVESRRQRLRSPGQTLGEAGTDAIGLALSGGGIRSATFSLGVLQTLAAKVELKDIDLMSTVSGGGYLGCFLETHGLEVLKKQGDQESSAVRHLRNHSKYLTEGRLKTILQITLNLLLGPVAALLLLGGLGGLLWLLLSLLPIAAMANGIRAYTTDAAFWPICGGTFVLALLVRLTSAYPMCAVHKLQQWALGLSVLAASLAIGAGWWVDGDWMIRTIPLTELLDSWWSEASIPHGLFLTVLLVLTVWAWYHIDINTAGLHHYYRQRLARTFLRSKDKARLLADSPSAEASNAPYLLVNTALNVPDSLREELRGRRSDLFVLSRHWCGSAVTGWRRTTDLHPPITLATAMTVSAAAASPHMGTLTRRRLAMPMSLLGWRLGHWLRWPGNAPGWIEHLMPPALDCLLREMTGWRMDERQHWLNLSDGGHIENLGLYELLRRHCRYIIAIDGECDPEHHFGGLLNLVRMAAIDLGVHIEPDLTNLRPDQQGLTSTHFVMGSIKYPGESTTGLLLYVKSSMTGDESEYLHHYRQEHPTFPHESTAQQLFSEQQFEAYRALGEHIGHTLFVPALTPATATSDAVRPIAPWMNELAQKLLPTDRAV